MRIFSALTDEHRKAAVEFYKARQDYSVSLQLRRVSVTTPSGKVTAPRTPRS